jgi:hypothetical protein
VAWGLTIRPLADPSGFATMPVDQQQTIGLGTYLANAAQCGDCHSDHERAAPGKIDLGQYLTGGQTFTVPPPLQPILKQTLTMSADLVGSTHGFFNEPEDSLGRFLAVITSGTHFDESTDGEPARALGWPMPWQTFGKMETGDLSAIYAYMKTVPQNAANDKLTQDYSIYCAANADCAVRGGTCDVPTHTCTGNACTGTGHADACTACQTCVASVCTLPAAADTCPALGIP